MFNLMEEIRWIQGAIATVLVALCTFWGSRIVRLWRWQYELSERALSARSKRDTSANNVEVPTICEKLAVYIRSLSAIEISKEIKEGKIRAIDAVIACIRHSRAVGRVTNCCAEDNYVAAMKAAHAVDDARAKGEWLPPLAGVPISVKDTIDQEGFSSTCGLAVRTMRPRKKDSVLLSILRNAGAIPVIRSAVPQALMFPETMSAHWGVASNPWNVARTPGGSSGGEGVLIATGATPVGIGSDIGGSIRIPAHFCGIVGFKPTPNRISKCGMAVSRLNNVSGQEAVISVAGPMARCVDDCELVMQLWLRKESVMWSVDPYTSPVPWRRNRYIGGAAEIRREQACANAISNDIDENSNSDATRKASRKMRIGYFIHDGWFAPAPACARAVREAARALGDADVECVKLEVPEMWRVVQCYYALASSDGNMRGMREGCEGEALHKYYRKLRMYSAIPRWIRGALCWVLRLFGLYRLSAVLSCTAGKSTYEFWQWVAERKRLQAVWLQMMRREKVDAILAPGMSLPALPHGMGANLTPAFSYTLLFNLLHWPAGTVPVTLVRPDECSYVDDLVPKHDPWLKSAVKACLGSEGLPCGVQVATLPYEDELCLHVMKRVEQAVNFSHSPTSLPCC